MKKSKYSIPLAVLAGLALAAAPANAATPFSIGLKAVPDTAYGNDTVATFTSASVLAEDGTATFDISIDVTPTTGTQISASGNSNGYWGVTNKEFSGTEAVDSIGNITVTNFNANGGSMTAGDVSGLSFGTVTYGGATGSSDAGFITAGGNTGNWTDMNAGIPQFAGHGSSTADTQVLAGGAGTIVPSIVLGATGTSSAWKIFWIEVVGVTTLVAGDATPPNPDPMTWASVPTAVSETEITMTATEAINPEGGAVQYRFNNTTLVTNSGWQSSPIFIDTGLTFSTEYFYTVEARDGFQNTTDPSTPAVSATTDAQDLTAPPTPAFTIAPNALSFSEITMTVGAVVDPEGNDVEYYFTCTSGGGHDSGWQASLNYTDRWLTPSTAYEYTVKSRDLSPSMNESLASAASLESTLAVPSGQKLYSFEDFDDAGLVTGNPAIGANAFMDYDNTTTGTNNGVEVRANIGVIPGPNGQYVRLDGGDSRHISTQAGLLTLGTDKIESLDVSFSVQYANTDTRDFSLEYSALGDFSDTVVQIFNRNPGDIDTLEEDVWYHITETIDFSDVTFTDTAALRWLTRVDKNTELDDIIIVGTVASPDGTAPPTPAFTAAPAAISTSEITMTAGAVVDPEGGGVEYYFTETSGNGGNDSGWQSSTSYTDSGLLPETTYAYTVKARDLPGQNESAASTPSESATTNALDITVPVPNPMTWVSEPAAVSMNEITMTASTATDENGVEYYFANLTDSSHDSGWQDSEAYTDAGLLPGTLYSYTVMARDKSESQNETDPSTPDASATTDPATGDILYADTFDRPEGTELNAQYTGKSGTLGALTYTGEAFPAESDVDILSESLRINSSTSNGDDGGLVYINDHNFLDAAILSSGGFSASVEIAQYSTAGSNRPAGLSLGSSLAELDSQSAASGAGSPADLFVALRQTTDTLEIYKNGVLDLTESVTGALVPTAPTTMRVECSFSDFNSSSTVTYKVFFDDVEATSGSFMWSGTEENYIGLQSNTTNNTRFDNLEIRSGVTASNDFSDWIAGYSVGGQTGIDDDPDNDGVDSGVENFFGTAPDAFSQGLVSGTVDTGANTFTFTHPEGTIADDLTAGYRWSKDLQTFYGNLEDGDGTTVEFTTQLDTPTGYTTVTATVTAGPTPDKFFVDVEVTQP
jgi:hypothetical protein